MDINRSFNTFLERGKQLFREEKYEEAIALYQEALKLYPENLTLDRNLGFAQEKTGNLDGEIISYQKGIKLEPQESLWVYETLTELVKKQNDLATTPKLVQQLLEFYPDKAIFYRELGVIQEKIGDFTGQLQSYQKAIEFNPQQPIWVYSTLGHLYIEKGEINQGIVILEKGIQLYPEELKVNLALRIGDIYYQNQDLENALKYYQKAKEIQPQKTWIKSKIEAIFFQKGIEQIKQGKIETAINEFKQVQEINLYNEPQFIPWLQDHDRPWPYSKLEGISPIQKSKLNEIKCPKISIVTPSFNQGDYIEETILSVINQNYPNLEYIIVDGQSSDQTQDILRKYQHQVSKIIIEPDKGQSNAINKGFSYSSGELMTWLNSDDMLAPGALYLAAITYLKEKSDLIAGICIIHKEHKIVSIRKPKTRSTDFTVEKLAEIGKYWCDGYYFLQPDVIFSRNIWHKIGGQLNEELEYVMDYELWLKMAKNKAKLTILDYPIACYRSHEKQKTSNYDFNPRCIIEQLKVRNEFYTIKINKQREKIIYQKINNFFNLKNRKILVIVNETNIIKFNSEKSNNIYYTNKIDNLNCNEYDALIILILLKDEISIIENLKKQGYNKLLIGWFWYNNCQYYQNTIIAEQLDICIPANQFLADILTNKYSLVTESLPICSLIPEINNYNTLELEPKEGFYIELPAYVTPKITTLINNIKQIFPESIIVSEKDEITLSQRFSYPVSFCLSMANEIPPTLITSWLYGQTPLITEDIWELDCLISPELQNILPLIKLTGNDPQSIKNAYQIAYTMYHKKHDLSRVKSIISDYLLLPKRIHQISKICYILWVNYQNVFSLSMEINKSTDDYLEIVNNLLTQSEYEQAIALCQEALTFYPENAALYRELGVVQERIGDYTGQLQSYQKALQLDSQQPIWVYIVLTRLLREAGKFAKAISVCQQGIELYPQDDNLSDLYRELGVVQERIGDIKGEISSYQKTIELNPAQPTWVYTTLDYLLKNEQINKLFETNKNYIREESETFLLSQLEQRPTKEGISVVTCCMNRNDNLVKSIPTWLDLKEIDEIIIVDWNSNIPVRTSLPSAGIKDERITIVRVIEQPKWILTFAYNVGLQLAKYDKILKIDADNQITPDFFEQNKLIDHNEFFAGNWKLYQNRHLNGTFYAWKKQLQSIGYFNEYIRTYGWDDSDIYERLTAWGYERKLLLEKTMDSIEHDDDDRLKYSMIHSINQATNQSQVIKKIQTSPYYHIQFNRLLTYSLPDWNKTKPRNDYQITLQKQEENQEKYELILKQVNQTLVISESLISLTSQIVTARTLAQYYEDDSLICNYDINTIREGNIVNISNAGLVSNQENVLVITLYNEKNEERCYEYNQCLLKNLQSNQFVRIIVLFEGYEIYADQSNKCLMAELIKPLQNKYPEFLEVHHIDNRPTYDDIFNFANQKLGNKIITIANADIYFDDSLSQINQVNFEKNILVLSRRELSQGSSLIKNSGNGLPNYLSADVWIFKTPLNQDFRGNYLIGTFFCDSFLNNQLFLSSNYSVYNPCLSIKAYHLHDESYNSSDAKKLDSSLIEKMWLNEYELCNQKNPVVGLPWCTIEDVIYNKSYYSFGQFYLDFNLLIIIEKTNPLNVIILIQKILNINSFYAFKIWIKPLVIEGKEESHPSTLLIKDYIEFLNNPRLSLNIIPHNYDESQHPLVNYQDCQGLDNFISKVMTIQESKQSDLLFVVFKNTCLESIDVPTFLSYEWNQKWLDKIKKNKTFNIYYQSWQLQQEHQNTINPLLINNNGHKNVPLISIVTSVYQGREFIQGFLENITQQTIFPNCELILIDGQSPENEGEIIEEFIRKNGFTNIHYQRLEQDPGLYECWNMAIGQSRGKYITNANLDDRRSPVHLEILANHLENNPQISAVSSALVVTYQPNEDWDLFTPDEVWFEGMSGEVTFDDLYTYNDHILVSRNSLHCMPLWKKELHSKYGYFDEPNYGTSADWEFWLRCSSQGEKFGIVGLPLGLYYLNPNSHNRRNDTDGSYELRIVKKYFDVNQDKIIKQ